MKCPFCGLPDSRVLDSRPVADGDAIRRRRECGGCGRRFTTYERVGDFSLAVVKKDGRRESFNRQKLLAGIVKACQKRPVSVARMEAIVDEIEKELRQGMEPEVESRQMGAMVMDRLRLLDEVAYVRFASVYREFRDAESFMQEVRSLKGKPVLNQSKGED
ncbi:MAG: transcriptional repressor NrdR [Peptococcaceae bacterium]|nr:MAG: transcriptional repressor NrdR [Peptococcaceae bacterium]